MSSNKHYSTRASRSKCPTFAIAQRPTKAFNAALLFLLPSALSAASCASYDDGIPAEQYDKQTPSFATKTQLYNSFAKWMDAAAKLQNSSFIQYPFCIYTKNVTQNAKSDEQVRGWSTVAMNTWLKPLIGQPQWRVKQAKAYRVEQQRGLCPAMDKGLRVYQIQINDSLPRSMNQSSDLQMYIRSADLNQIVILHEMGHAFGLADTYTKSTPVGQPSATMKNPWQLGGVLQQDDIDAVRLIWARIRGTARNPCPERYSVSKVTNTETYCQRGNGTRRVKSTPPVVSKPPVVDNRPGCVDRAAPFACQKVVASGSCSGGMRAYCCASCAGK